MERAIGQSVMSVRSERAFESSSFVFSRIKTPEQTVRIYCAGKLGLDERLVRLPDLVLDKNCKVVKLEKKIRVFRLPLRIGPSIKFVYVKQHNALSFWHRLTSLFCASAALRSLSGAATLLREGYATARPIAAVEYRRRGVLIKSFYVSEEIAGAKTIADYWREELRCLEGIEGRLKRRVVLRTLARLFKSLHQRGIYHNDLKASNVLALDRGPASKEFFSLIDLQGVKKCFYVSQRRRIKNLAQINRTLGSHLTRTEKLCFIKAYAGDHFSDQRKTRQLVRSIQEETNRQITKGMRRRSKQTSIHALKRRLVDPLEGLSISMKIVGCFKMTKVFGIFRRSILTLGISFGLGSIGYAHSGIVDGYGCHRAADKVTYHCHQGQFAGRTFKSKEDFLRQLRGGRSEQLSPKSNPPQIERKIEE